MQIVELTVTLLETDPEISRTLEVPADLRLDRLHETLQAAFGWESAHLYQFCVGEPYQDGAARWIEPNFVEDPNDQPANKSTLAQALETAAGVGLTYLYDFGDDWEHEIVASAPVAADPAQIYPRLTGITGTCPPEDIGGPFGFDAFKEAMANPKHPEHKEMKSWFGKKFDPNKPAVKTLTANVEKLAKRWAK